jgi:hypothetical protein
MLLKTGDFEVLKHKRNGVTEELVLKEKYKYFTVSITVHKKNIDYVELSGYIDGFIRANVDLKHYFNNFATRAYMKPDEITPGKARDYFAEYEPGYGFKVTDNII